MDSEIINSNIYANYNNSYNFICIVIQIVRVNFFTININK